MPEENAQSTSSWKDFILICIYGPLIVAQIAFVFKFYNYLGMNLLLYVGWVVFVLFLLVGYLPTREFRKKGGVPKGKSYMETTTLVDTGIYAVVRHPQFLSWILLSFSLALTSQYWLSAVCVVFVTVLIHVEAVRADASNIEKFGNDYRKYMQNVPRLSPVVGMYRLLRRK